VDVCGSGSTYSQDAPCSESQQLFSSFSLKTQHSSFGVTDNSSQNEQICSKSCPPYSCLALSLFFSLVRFPNYVFLLRTRVAARIKMQKKTKRRNRKMHVPFSLFLSKLPVSNVVRKGLSRVVSQPLSTPPQSHTHS